MAGTATTALRPGRTGAPGGRRSALRRGVTRLARLGFVAQLQLVVLVLVCAALVAEDSSHAFAVRRAEVAAADLIAAMADQQTGLLTYLKVVQPDSLVLYAEGSVRGDEALAGIRSGTARTPDAAAAARVEAAVRRWRAWAEALHAQQRPLTDPIDIAEGRHLFGEFTAELNALELDLEAESSQANDRIVRSTAISLAAVVADSLAVALVAGLFSVQVVRLVLAPLRALAAAAGRVAAEGLAAYPPGIPNVLPGERLTTATLDYIRESVAHGGYVRGGSDRQLKTLRVTREGRV